ncbi:PREDICTED: UPF0544 protein C5orf45 homolog [Tinamus guttatus]|uniref:UPF0544 protein C5orf45 homolog n=1 Tax=Tinamus guttatus TaxID=94827 RepID=UPI00052EAA2D|nr:PREDICTED: UPF0544 protein C5orf45 homolog [Tinamus guttatus]
MLGPILRQTPRNALISQIPKYVSRFQSHGSHPRQVFGPEGLQEPCATCSSSACPFRTPLARSVWRWTLSWELQSTDGHLHLRRKHSKQPLPSARCRKPKRPRPLSSSRDEITGRGSDYSLNHDQKLLRGVRGRSRDAGPPRGPRSWCRERVLSAGQVCRSLGPEDAGPAAVPVRRCPLRSVLAPVRARLPTCSQLIYGEGSALDCRLHVQKLNLLQGEVEEARSWTPRYVEDSIDANKNRAVESEGRSLVQQGGKAEVSRWSKYLDESKETQEDEDEEESGERNQFCSWRKNTVEGQRKHQKSFPYTDVQELSEENGAFQIANQAKKRKQCSHAVLNQDDGAAGCGDRIIPAESAVPEGSTQTPAPSIKPSKWEKFLSFSDNCSETTAKVTLPPQEGSRKSGPPSTAADIFMTSKYSSEAGNFLPPGLGDTEFKKCLASAEQLASKLPSTSLPGACSKDVVFQEPQGPLLRAGSAALESPAGRGPGTHTAVPMCPPAPALVLSPPGHKPGSTFHNLFCTGEEFDDHL